MIKLPSIVQGHQNLYEMYERADFIDREEAKLAYSRYNFMMRTIADKYGRPLHDVVAAFCALSPNSDYLGNLRSLVSVLEGLRNETPANLITVSTYNHCKNRAIGYLSGHPFYTPKRGLKTANFYMNILQPDDSSHVTIDGHMVAAYAGRNDLTMKEAGVGKRAYTEIALATNALAGTKGLLPNQVQATVWFARKRSLGVVYDPHFDLFGDPTDRWGIIVPIDALLPYPEKVL